MTAAVAVSVALPNYSNPLELKEIENCRELYAFKRYLFRCKVQEMSVHHRKQHNSTITHFRKTKTQISNTHTSPGSLVQNIQMYMSTRMHTPRKWGDRSLHFGRETIRTDSEGRKRRKGPLMKYIRPGVVWRRDQCPYCEIPRLRNGFNGRKHLRITRGKSYGVRLAFWM